MSAYAPKNEYFTHHELEFEMKYLLWVVSCCSLSLLHSPQPCFPAAAEQPGLNPGRPAEAAGEGMRTWERSVARKNACGRINTPQNMAISTEHSQRAGGSGWLRPADHKAVIRVEQLLSAGHGVSVTDIQRLNVLYFITATPWTTLNLCQCLDSPSPACVRSRLDAAPSRISSKRVRDHGSSVMIRLK